MLYNNYTVVNKIKVVNKSGIRFMDHRVIAESTQRVQTSAKD